MTYWKWKRGYWRLKIRSFMTTKFFTTSYHNYDVVECNWWRKNDEFMCKKWLITLQSATSELWQKNLWINLWSELGDHKCKSSYPLSWSLDERKGPEREHYKDIHFFPKCCGRHKAKTNRCKERLFVPYTLRCTVIWCLLFYSFPKPIMEGDI